MKKKAVRVFVSVCLIMSCALAFSACGGEEEAPNFYGKSFVLNSLYIDYDAQFDSTTLGAILEANLSIIDWKATIRANNSTINYETFAENVTTMTRLKEIFATFGSGLFGAKITFNDKASKSGTLSIGDESDTFVVDDRDDQGANASLKSSKGEEFAIVSLNYSDDGKDVKCLQFIPIPARTFKVVFTEDMSIPYTGTEFTFYPELRFYPAA